MDKQTIAFAGELLNKVRKMRLKEWDADKHGLVEQVSKRSDMPALFVEFTLKTIEEARCRVIIRRAYRKRYGPNANVAHPDTTIHQNFGRF
ncbi:hypothetical protein EV128_1257 [Rhizobium azibense]|nr:hypothetical protein EV128_1257 [Rhizobium azibense]